MSTYKKKRIDWIAQTFNDQLNRSIELVNQITEKYDIDRPLPNEPLTQEYWGLVETILDEIRDEYFCTEKIAQNLFFTTLRLRRRGKI